MVFIDQYVHKQRLQLCIVANSFLHAVLPTGLDFMVCGYEIHLIIFTKQD